MIRTRSCRPLQLAPSGGSQGGAAGRPITVCGPHEADAGQEVCLSALARAAWPQTTNASMRTPLYPGSSLPLGEHTLAQGGGCATSLIRSIPGACTLFESSLQPARNNESSHDLQYMQKFTNRDRTCTPRARPPAEKCRQQLQVLGRLRPRSQHACARRVLHDGAQAGGP